MLKIKFKKYYFNIFYMKNTSTTVQNITVIPSPRMCLNTANFTTCVNTAKIDMTWASEVRGKYHCHVCNTIS